MSALEAPAKIPGSHRSRTPSDSWSWLQGRLGHFGITRVANVTGLDSIGLPVCVAVRPNSRGLAVSQGKGSCLNQARVSAAMESIEAWHAERCGKDAFVGTWWQARAEGLNVVPIDGFPHRATSLPLLHMPLSFIKATDIRSDRAVWLPLDCVTTDFVIDVDAPPVFMRSSNGLAAGNTMTEARCQALAEVLERDAVQRWFAAGGFTRPAARWVDCNVPRLRTLLSACREEGVDVLVWDLCEFAAAPCFVVLLAADESSARRRDVGLFSGYGCHRCPHQALVSALHEAIQSRLTLITGSRDDLLPWAYAQCRSSQHTQSIRSRQASAPLLTPPGPIEPSSLDSDFDFLLWAIDRRYAAPVYLCDLTHSDIGIPVTKAVVPGLLNIGSEQRYYLQRMATIR